MGWLAGMTSFVVLLVYGVWMVFRVFLEGGDDALVLALFVRLVS